MDNENNLNQFKGRSKNNMPKQNDSEFGFDSSQPIISRKKSGPYPEHLSHKVYYDKKEFQKTPAASPNSSSQKGSKKSVKNISSSGGKAKNRKKGKKKRRKWPYILIAVLLLLAGAFAYLWNSSFFLNPSDVDRPGLDKAIGGHDKNISNILIIGVDSDVGRETNQLTDTILILSLNSKEKTANILQIPRDTYIGTEYTSTSKINALYSAKNSPYYGIEGLANFIFEKMAIPIDHYATVTMEGFRSLIDNIGGVTVDIPFPIDLDGVTIPAGTHTLDGNETEKFVRQRHGKGYYAGDLTRLEVQRTFMAALAEKLLHTNKMHLISLLPGLVKEISTDLTIGQMSSLISTASGLSTDKIYFKMVPGESTTVQTKTYGKQSVYSIHKQLLSDIINESFRSGLGQITANDIKIPEIANTSNYYDNINNSADKLIS